MTKAEPFQIEVTQDVLDDLQNRLQNARWTDGPEDACWNYGTNPQYLQELVQYWQSGYDWRAHEAKLNEQPHFKAEIDGVGIHFIHKKGEGEHTIPLILTHGWPDSFYRYYKVIDGLTSSGRGPSFDVVIPSIPGFGFSDKVALNNDQTAGLWVKLMTEVLGYDTFAAAGGDMGTGITKSLANQYPEQVTAIHLTDVGYPNGNEDRSTMSEAEQEFGQFIEQWFFTEGGFNIIQSTKPQTLGYGLNDSPVGLASWILEKFHAWSDNGGDIENSFTKDELLTNIMIYWVSQTINSSIRIYRQNAMAGYSGGLQASKYVETPTGVAVFPGEAPIPQEWAERMANVKQFNTPSKGGHFAALEEPELWINELKTFFQHYG